ncbi:MAG: RNA polymerase sigma factor SigJ [Acidimicrobiales bacterium]
MNPESVAEHRDYLLRVAYRLLGSMDDAEEVVQEAALRAAGTETEDVREPRAWLTRVVTNLALDRLRSAPARREEYVGSWLPEPRVGDPWSLQNEDPGDEVVRAAEVSLALLTVLESLSPAERAVFVLHEAFALPLSEVAGVVGRSEAACRQLAVRARRHVDEQRPRFDPDRAERVRVVASFEAACVTGDLVALASVLDDDVLLRADGGGVVKALARPLSGRDKVAATLARTLAGLESVVIERRMVNGEPGLVVQHSGGIAVVALVVAGGRLTHVDIVANPDKLRRVDQQA